MGDYKLTPECITAYGRYLKQEEKSTATQEKYLRDITVFVRWLGSSPVTKENVTGWKEHLQAEGRAPTTINTALSALNGLFRFLGWEGCRAKFLKIQRRMFRDQSRELTRADYDRLIATAWERGQNRLALLMETICATGIRVSELRYITMEATKNGKTQISMKGKFRTILLPSQLCRKLKKYAVKNGIKKGEIFLNAKGNSLDRRWIWAKMKALCRFADISKEKVFPHNLRHLFARCFYRASRDLSALADMLGHSSIETTRIYLVSTEEIYAKKIARLGLVRQTK